MTHVAALPRGNSHHGKVSRRFRIAITEAIESEPVAAAYVHGSHARGGADSSSDLDLALLASDQLSPSECSSLRLRVTQKLLSRLGDGPEPDVVILQQAPVLLQYNVIRHSIVVHGSESSDRAAFELGVERRYDDDEPILEQETAVILDRILSLRH